MTASVCARVRGCLIVGVLVCLFDCVFVVRRVLPDVFCDIFRVCVVDMCSLAVACMCRLEKERAE